MERHAGPGWKRALSWVACLLAVALLLRALAHVDVARALGLVAHAGPLLVLVLVPYVAAASLDALGWCRVLEMLGRRVGWPSLLRVRITADAVTTSLPGGAAVAESLNPWLLLRHGGVPVEDAVPAMAGRRWLVMRAHALYITAGAVVGWPVLAAVSRPLVGGDWLPWGVLSSAAVPLAVSLALSTTLTRGAVAERLRVLLRRVPIEGWRRWLDRGRSAFTAADAGFVRIARDDRGRAAQATALFLGAWLVESLETLLILRVVGARIGFVEVVSFEAGLSLVRCMAFFTPGGLGVQDIGYLSFLSALNVPDASAVGAAFVLIKRAKELVWVAIGYALVFVADPARARRASRRDALGDDPAVG